MDDYGAENVAAAKQTVAAKRRGVFEIITLKGVGLWIQAARLLSLSVRRWCSS